MDPYTEAVTADLNARAKLVSAIADVVTVIPAFLTWITPFGKQLVEKAVAEATKG